MVSPASWCQVRGRTAEERMTQGKEAQTGRTQLAVQGVGKVKATQLQRIYVGTYFK